MSNARKYKLAQVISEAQKKHPDIEIEFGDGTVATLPPAQRWSDEIVEGATDPLGTAKRLLGDKYEQFVAEGGSATILVSLLQDDAGVSLGESSPS